MGLSARLRRLEGLALADCCRHQPVRVLDPEGPPAPPVRRCRCGLEPLVIAIEYVGAEPSA
jgi:hypothetical protein